jgi:hypothetical protein
MSVIKAFDFLGTTPNLFINGQKSYKTILGGIISLTFSLCVIIGTSYFLNLLVSRVTFTIETSEEYNPNSFADWNGTEFMITLLDKFAMSYPEPERLFGVTSMWSKFEEITKPDNTKMMELKMIPVKLEKCNLTKHFGDSSLWSKYKFVNISYCVNNNEKLNLTKPLGHNNFTSMWFWVHRCKNTTFKNDCYPPEKIEEDMMNANVALGFKSFFFDHKKTKDIGMPYIFSDAPIASTTNYRRVRYTLREVEYTIDNGLILPNQEENNYVTFHSLRESIDFRKDPVVPGALVGISFDMHILKQNIKKNYYKFQNMLADLGGLYKAVLTIATFFNSYFSDRFYFNDIIEKNLKSLTIKKNNFSSTDSPVERIPKSGIESGFLNKINLEQSQNNLLNLNRDLTKKKFNENNLSMKNNNSDQRKNYFKTNEIRNLKLEKYDKKIIFEKLKFREILTPFWCYTWRKTTSNKNFYYKLQKIIIKQLDIACLVEKINNLDKICMILTGSETKKILDECITPNFYEEDPVIAMAEFNEVKNRILSNLSSFIFDSQKL